ncbi:MAG: hypothetical protein Q9227_005205 [Pyrenula ochraceoflavens]
MSDPSTLFITGVTGFIGFQVLLEALTTTPHKILAVIRKESQIPNLTTNPHLSTHPRFHDLSFTIIPDLTVPGAFDSALSTPNLPPIQNIIHIASPLPHLSDDYESTMIRPAVSGTLSLLTSAHVHNTKITTATTSPQNPSRKIHRIILTSSLAALVPFSHYPGPPSSSSSPSSLPYTYPPTSIVSPTPTAPFDSPFHAYAASKIAALSTTSSFLSEHSPSFEVVNVMAPFVIGPDRHARTANEALRRGSNGSLLGGVLFGDADNGDNGDDGDDGGKAGSSVHVDDLAWLHVVALDPQRVKFGKREKVRCLGAACNGVEGVVWEDAKRIVRSRFPEEVGEEEGKLRCDGRMETKRVVLDARETEGELGVRFRGFEEQVVGAVGRWVELKREEEEREKMGNGKVD